MPFSEIEGGSLLSTCASNHSWVVPVVVAVGEDCKSISFKPPKLGIKESATGIIISWPRIILSSGGVDITWPDDALPVVTTVGITATTEVEFGRV